jgi:hypothetical protein
MLTLRAFSVELAPQDAHSLEDEEIVAQIARSLRERRLHVCRETRGNAAAGGAPPETAEQKPEESDSPAAPQRSNKAWVEFAVVDMEGNPAPGHRFVAMLPDGSLQEGTLGKTGRVRFEHIDPDTCVFSLPDLDRDAWERAD